MNRRGPESCRRECLLAGLLLALFVAINLAVATHTPTVNPDESGYADPAANLYLGSGFTSTIWAQGSHEFWCGNVPLYQFILYADFKLFGFGLFQARAANTFLAAGAAFLIWAALRFSKFTTTANGRLLSLALILSGAVSTLTFRTIRPDATMFFICALVFFCSQLPVRLRYRCLLAGAISALLPFAGVPMLPYAGLMAGIGFISFGWAEAGVLGSVCLGVGAGIGLLAIFYNHFSSFKTFLGIVLPFTLLGSQTEAGMWHSKVFGDEMNPDNLLTCFFGNPFSLLDQKTICDYSAVLLFGLFLVMAIGIWRTASPGARRGIIFVMLLTLVVPPVMHIAGHYRSMYRWMTYIPLTVAVPWILGMKPEHCRLKAAWYLVTVTLAAALIAGIPARTLLILPKWAERSTAPLEQATADIVRADDVVVCSYATWFAVRPHARQVYCGDSIARGAFWRTVDLPTNSVSLLCLWPGEYARITGAIGGNWRKIEAGESASLPALAKTRYAVNFYRRVKE